MRLATALANDTTRLLAESPAGALVDLAAANPELANIADVCAALSRGVETLDEIRRTAADAGPEHLVREADVQFAAPVLRPGKIICVGLNYRRHALESNTPVPERPVLFAKFGSATVGQSAEVVYPAITECLDYEGELGVVIGVRAKDIAAERAIEVVAGYVAANDISARDVQDADPGGQWLRGKSLDSFGPMGPYLVTPDEVGDWRQLRIQTRVNGEVRQNELCDDMVFGVEELIAFISRDLTLEPGDVILTGTPSGVAYSFEPPRWLQPGDVVEVEIGRLGVLTSKIVAASAGASAP